MLLNKKVLVTSLSGLQYGYNTSIIAAAILFLKSGFSLDAFQEGVVAGIVLLGALLMSFFTGKLANALGRKWTNFLSTVLFLIGVALSTFTQNYFLLLVGRFITGLAGAIAIMVPPIYLIEVSPPEERGAAANFNQVGIALGALIAYTVGYFLADTGNWRWMFGLGFLPGIIQLIGLQFIPESPYKSEKASEEEHHQGWKHLFKPTYRSRFSLGLVLCVCQSLLGAPAIFYFAPILFESAGMTGNENALLVTIMIGVVYLLGIIVSAWTVDYWGRRSLTLISTSGMTLSLLIVALFFYLIPGWVSVVIIPAFLFFICCYAVGIGPIPPLVISEITPTSLRGDMMGFTGFIGLTSNCLVTLTCPLLLNNLHLGATMLIYAIFGILGFSFFLKKLPETKGKSLSEMRKLFS